MTAPPPTLRVLVCGSADRGDDGAALSAIAHVLPELGPETCQRLEVRRCPQLDATDLIDVRPGEACLILDTVVGVEPGRVVQLPLAALAQRGALAPRSSHALPIQQVVGLAEVVRESLPPGLFVGIGGKWFGFGETRSRALREAMPAFESAVLAAILELTGTAAPIAWRRGAP
jgi:hydrogenase maturation protease